MAFKSEYFNKWGKHYLKSISKAHLAQIRNNFKDPGVQHYCSTQIYDTLREQLNDIFNNLPAPKPSGYVPYTGVSSGPISMSSFNNPQGGCLSSDSPVTILKNYSDMLTVRMDQLKVGDLILTNNLPYQYARINKIIVTKYEQSKPFKMVGLQGGLKITPWHPVNINYKWTFPEDLVASGYAKEMMYNNDVYNLVLDNPTVNTSFLSGGYSCIGLGHGITGDLVASHEYLGTNRIIDDLNKLKTNSDGKLYLKSSNFIRDEVTGLITTIKI